MNAAHNDTDCLNLKNLTGAELLLLRLRQGKSIAFAVERELNRRAGVAYEGLEVGEVMTAVAPVRRRSCSSAA